MLFFGFRGLIGWDWYNYYPSFIAGKPIEDIELGISDLGFDLYETIIRSFTSNYQIFVFINTTIDTIVLNYIFKRYSPYYALSFAVFLVVSLGTEVDTIRNMKSIEIFLLSLRYVEKRNIWKYMGMMILAILFHASAILYIPFYFYGTLTIKRKWYLWIIIIGNLVYLLNIPLIKPMVLSIANIIGGRIAAMGTFYLNSEIFSAARGISPTYIERLATSILVYIYYNRIISMDKQKQIFLNLFISYVIVSAFFAEISILFYRVGAMFIISYWIIWPLLLKCIKLKNNKYIYISYVMILSYFLVAVRSNTILYKYDNVLWGIESYNHRVTIRDWAAPLLLK